MPSAWLSAARAAKAELAANHRPDDLAADLQQAESLLRGEQNYYTLEKRYIRQDGEVVWVLQAVSLMRDLEGNPLYFISQIEDISGLKQSGRKTSG